MNVALIKLQKVENPKDSNVRKYLVRYNKKTIGSVERWESYLWSANPNWEGLNLINDSNNRKTAVKRLVVAYETKMGVQ